MRTITVVAAGLGWRTLEAKGLTEMAGLRFEARESSFPAVTCVAQADLRTGLKPKDHGMVANGYWSEVLRRPLFWEQSARLIRGPRIWEARRATGGKVGMFFFQQSLGESVDVILSPAPIHKHGGGMVMATYTKPSNQEPLLKRLSGSFPLWRYWGMMASPKIGRKCVQYFEAMTDMHDVDEAYLYLPTLDYAAQKYGPKSSAGLSAWGEFKYQLERLANLAARRGAALKVTGDYEITEVTSASVRPNVVLRQAGLFKVRNVAGRAYPDFYESRAFAMCDHEFCIVYGEEREAAIKALLATGEYELDEQGAIDGLLLARPGSWCEYKWWTRDSEAPDYAAHVDIHNKPGYDPNELFWFCRGTVKGTHGRRCEVAATLDFNS